MVVVVTAMLVAAVAAGEEAVAIAIAMVEV